MSTMRPCDTHTMRAFDSAARLELERAAFNWGQGVGEALLEATSRENLPGHGSRETRNWRSPFNQTGWLRDRGCIPWTEGPRDTFKHTDRHSFSLWRPAVGACPGVKATSAARDRNLHSDGLRSMCALSAQALREDCTVYSVGSKGNFKFERAILRATSHCFVHTFDCTMNGWSSTKNISSRNTFHPLCLSATNGVPTPRYRTLHDLTIVLGQTSMPSLLKLDIEGFERRVLLSWRSEDKWLPEQLLVEVHCYTDAVSGSIRFLSTGEQVAFLAHMHAIGYRLVDLRWEGGGVDATFVRAMCPAE